MCHTEFMNDHEPATVRRFPAPDPAQGRALHLVDVENLLGGTDFTEADVAAVARNYRQIARVGADDLVVVASSHHTALPVWFGWGEARRLVRSGSDGADLALLDVVKHEDVAVRFERVVIGSGDGIFAFGAAALQRDGVGVTVVSQRESLSRQLRLAVRDIRLLARELEPAVAAGIA